MQLTLVSHYGEKERELTDLIKRIQDMLAEHLKSDFRPYQPEQVHGTVVGLEGHRKGDKVRNKNSQDLGPAKQSLFDVAELLEFLKGDEFPTIDIRIGGYRRDVDYKFESRGQHPYVRSFSIQDTKDRPAIGVAMGWPVLGETFPDSINELRWRFDSMGIRHKWHKKNDDRDNDFFFVLGRIDRRFAKDPQVQLASERARVLLAGIENGTRVQVCRDTLHIVAYLDPQLPLETSSVYRVTDPKLRAEDLLDLWEPIE